jgi:hypothetical protein
MGMGEREARYLQILLHRIAVCAEYQPKFGQATKERGLNLQQFQTLYGQDPFYAWFGLDHVLMYAAHRAAGGITSIYRQIGTGCEELFRQLLRDEFELTAAQATWSYTQTAQQRTQQLSLDGRLALAELASVTQRERVQRWLTTAAQHLDIAPPIAAALQGAVFEVRQGYKSKDAKRQNADLANAATAYSQGYLPVLFLLSNQIDKTVAERYARHQWLVLYGSLTGTATHSAYRFAQEILNYDLAHFFAQHAPQLQSTIETILQQLLKVD